MSQRETDKRRISLELSEELLTWIDSLKGQLGLRSRGDLVERLLQEVRGGQDTDTESESAQEQLEIRVSSTAGEESNEAEAEESQAPLNEDVSIVLVHSGLVAQQDLSDVSGNTCLLYTSPSPRDRTRSRMPSSA